VKVPAIIRCQGYNLTIGQWELFKVLQELSNLNIGKSTYSVKLIHWYW